MRSQYRPASVAPGPADDGAREDAYVLALEQKITRLELFVFDVLPQDARAPRALSPTPSTPHADAERA